MNHKGFAQGTACARLMTMVTLLVVRDAVAVAASDPIGHWRLEGTTAGAEAHSPSARSLKRIMGATFVDGVIGRALAFDGRDDYAELGDLGERDAVTIAFWMKGANVGKSSDWQGLVTSDAWEAGVLHIGVRNGGIDVHLHLGGARRGRLRSAEIANGEWYHVAVTADTRARQIWLYVNGRTEDSAGISRLPTALKLIKQVVGREIGKRYFHGAIDDVRIYGRALSLAEVRALCPGAAPRPGRDLRNIRTGHIIPDEGYCDQPYVVVTKDGNWLCTLTTGKGREGQRGQHVVSTTSADKGATWSPLTDIEPANGPEASWVVPFAARNGRVYAFYTYNGDNVRQLGGRPIRADTLGWYAFKYSDDNGRTWSARRYRLPMRVTACDRENNWRGRVQLFWGICKPVVAGEDVYFSFTKLGRYILTNGEGWLYRSDNLLQGTDPATLRWELLPEGDNGVRAPEFGSVQEEHNIVALGRGALYCVYRTTKGYACHAYSRDGGRTWTKPEFMTYTPGGQRMKNPRACPRIWRCGNGKFLFWFHNNNGQSFRGRNPAWVSGGVERDGRIHWSQPEILLYDPTPSRGMSYPDLIEQDGRYWITETNKTVARVHEIDGRLLEGLWRQGDAAAVAQEGLALSLGPAELKTKRAAALDGLDLRKTGGLALGFWIMLDDLAEGQIILDSREAQGRGILVATGANATFKIQLNDERTTAAWESDPGLLTAGELHHAVISVDNGPRIITFVVDGVLCDGGAARQYGWGRYPRGLGDVSGSGALEAAPSLKGGLRRLRVYRRYLRTSEAIGNYRAGP